MDRTIKFRVWNGGRMLYPEYFGSNAYGSQGQITIGWTNQSYIDLGSIRKEPYEAWEGCTLMQFTGLYDSEGKEIYERDIVNVNLFGEQVTCVVLWRNDFYCYAYLPIEYAKESLEGWGDAFKSQLTYYDEVTVLGNLYEHPNLLNNESNT